MGFSDKSYLSVFLVFVVKLASFLMFTLAKKIRLSVWRIFREKSITF